MEQLMNLIQINRNFQKSVNLQLDLGDTKRIAGYIPTRSSTAILRCYLETVAGKTKDHATILIGPYGKGKSHLLLVLLALLHGDLSEELWKKLNETEPELSRLYPVDVTDGMVKGCKKYLPVLVSSGYGVDLNQSFLIALQEALKREGFSEIAPETYFTQAQKVIEDWRKDYPAVYEALEETLKAKGSSIPELKKQFAHQNGKALALFQEIYPMLTAGSTFAPMLQSEALKTYLQVNRILTETYGYAGMFLVFDEFSKYIEGHETAGFSADMKTLQDMCELADNSRGALFLTMVAHKSIHEYGRSIPEELKNAFRGVEGRIKEIPFVVSSRNNYELIADTIQKKEPDFSKEYEKICKKDEQFERIVADSYEHSFFAKLFSSQEYHKIVGIGCFPLTPFAAYALLHISEKVAQNERTIFTFLSGEEQGSLPWLLKRGIASYVGIDKIYDYFKNLFRENIDAVQLHNEWLKAEYAISRIKTVCEKENAETEIAIVKAVSVIRMIHREEEFPAQDAVIRLALGISGDIYAEAMGELKAKDILIYRSSRSVYAFRSNVGVDVEKEITRKMEEYRGKINTCQTIQAISELDYELPKKYNQEYAITRYFQYEYLLEEEFYKLQNTEYLFSEKFSDGKIILLIAKGDANLKQVQKHLDELSDERVLVLVSERGFSMDDLLCRYEAVSALMQDAGFMEENQVLFQELELCREDIAFEVNVCLEQNFLPEYGNASVLRAGFVPQKCKNSAGFNAILSEICREYYGFSPKVNHELLNVEHIGSQYLRARNQVVQTILQKKDTEEYLTGTTPAAMVYRAAFVHTKSDAGCRQIYEVIREFFLSCAGTRKSFKELYEQLQGKQFGMRKGIFPLFLAKQIADTEGTAVIYIEHKEHGIDAEILNKVNEFPWRYELYIEPESAAKEQYILQLSKLFKISEEKTESQNRIASIAAEMQKWYRGLPQYTMVTGNFPAEWKEPVVTLRNLLRKAEVNPRELLFERLPECFPGYGYDETIEGLSHAMKLLEERRDRLNQEMAVRIKKEFGAKEENSLKGCLTEWYDRCGRMAKNHVLTASIQAFLNYIESIATNDEIMITERIAKIVSDLYLDDWNDSTSEQFATELHAIREEVELMGTKETELAAGNCIILKGADGSEMQRFYDADTSDSTSLYFKNMLEEAIEDFGSTLEVNQKVAILVQTLEGLLK